MITEGDSIYHTVGLWMPRQELKVSAGKADWRLW